MPTSKRSSVPSHPTSPGQADVFLDDQGIINIVGRGHITGPLATQMLGKLQTLTQQLRHQHLPVYVLVDLSHITGHDSEARLAVRHASDLDFTRSAAFGGNAALGLIMQYLQRGFVGRVHHFRTRTEAVNWLHKGEKSGLRYLSSLPVTLAALGLAILGAVLTTGYLSWQAAERQTASESRAALSRQADDTAERIGRRIQAYEQSLFGVRGLYAASTEVTRKEFHNYFTTLNLAAQYPGFSSMSYVKRVKNADKGSYLGAMRTDKSLNPQGYPDFRIYPGSFKDEYLVKTYNEPLDDSPLGFDLTSNPERLQMLTRARDNDAPAASTTIQLEGEGQGRGFLLALPLFGTTSPTTADQRRTDVSGYVTFAFEYDKFFGSLLPEAPGSPIKAAVLDTEGRELYSTAPLETAQQISRTLTIGGQKYQVILSAPAGYGLSPASQNLPLFVLLSGAVMLALLLIIMTILLRSRSQAMKLAGTMTEDLEHERDTAVARQALLAKAEDQLAKERAHLDRTVQERTQEVENNFAQLTASLSGLPFGLAIISQEDQVMFANDELARLIKRQIPADPVAAGRVLQDAAQDFAGSIDLIGSIREVRATHKPTQKVIAVGAKFYRILIASAALASPGPALLMLEDVTEDRAAQRSRDEFLSIASHELRTPLTAIRGNISLMLDIYGKQLKEPGLRQMVTDAHDASTRLVAIVNDFIDMSRLEQGQAAFQVEAVNLASVGEQVIREYEAMAKDQHLELKLDAVPASTVALADVGRVHQILANLISNALRYTEAGGITIGISSDKLIKVSVTDTGRGIPVEFQHLLFHKFQQATPDILTRDASRSTGLGLYISRLMAEGMHGRLYLEHSEIGKGSTFTLELPAA